MDCLKGCICGKQLSLKAIIEQKNVPAMNKFVKGLRSYSLAESLTNAAEKGDINSVYQGSMPLHEAVKAGNVEVTVALIKAGALLDEKDGNNETALDVAKGLGDKQMQKILLKESSQRETDQFVDGLDFVSKVPLFATLHPAEYPRLAAAFVSRSYKQGNSIIRQGEIGNEMYFIRKGNAEVQVMNPGDSKPTTVNVMGPGDYFGEVALLNETPRNATIVAQSALEVKVLSRANFQALDLRKKLYFTKRKAVCQVDERRRETEKRLLVKTPEQTKLIKTAIMANPNLGSLLKSFQGTKELDDVVETAFRVEVVPDEEVITQGELKADLFYVVEDGTLEVIVNGEKVLKYEKGGSFGELAMLFRAPRAATVKAVGAPKLWGIHRQDMRILMQANLKKKVQDRASMLGGMEIMRNVPEDDRLRLADALVETSYSKGDYVFRQGEEGRTFFIVYEGEVSIEVDNKEVARYTGASKTGAFDCFGERALETDEPRAASVKAVSPKVTLLALDRDIYMTVRGIMPGRSSTMSGDLVKYCRDELETLGLLGCGGFGVVTLVRCNITKHTFALKALSKGHILAVNQERSVMNEKGILRMTHSPFLVRLAATFNGDQHLYFLLEPALGGELFTIYQRKNLYGSERHARFYVACVLRAFEHLHARQIVYRDLKPENLLLDSKGYCKVTDFGLAKFVIGHTYTTCGTPDYFAPEMVMGLGHSKAVDWWTMGVLIYEMMMSDTPFSSPDTIHTFRKVQRGIEVVAFPDKGLWPSLVKALCKQDPSERLPVSKGGVKPIEEHPWFQAASFDWSALDARTMAAPYVPNVKSATDIGNFEASQEDAPPVIPYTNPGTGWDKDFEDLIGPGKFD